MSFKGASRQSSLRDFSAFEGGADDLAAAADAVLNSLGVLGDEDGVGAVNVRLIRDYAQRGILTRPERQGKEAVYGYRQLVELVAARILLIDGWPLAKVSDYVSSAETDDLAGLAVPKGKAKSPMQAINEIRQRANRPPPSGRVASMPRPALPPWTITSRQAKLAELKAELPSHLDRIGDAFVPPLIANYSTLSLAFDLHVLIGENRLKALTLEEAEAIGKAVTASLIQLRPKGGKP